MLSALIRLSIGSLDLDVDLEVGSGQVVAVLGPNGAGKTTLLRALAGLEQLGSGRIVLDDLVIEAPAEGVFVPAEGRPVGVVFQDYLLFPHLDVLDNVAFGPRARGVSKAAANMTASAWIDRVGLADLARAKPSAISGGQAQRVALARALATDPGLLLLDEPLAALDVATRATVRRDLRLHLSRFAGSTVLVTHDPLDALALADHVVILESGRVTQSGPIAEVTARPRTEYVAQLLGVNLLRGIASDRRVSLDDSGAVVTISTDLTGPALLLVRPSSVSLHLARPESSARNKWEATIIGFDLLGDHARVRLGGPISLIAEVTPAAIAELGLIEGMTVWASVKATDVSAYPT